MNPNPKTELLLYRLLWLADKPMRPTFRNIEDSFEGWAYHAGLLRQIARLEAQGFLESRTDPTSGKRLHRLTEAGRRVASCGKDPEAAWSRPWDRKWRLILFDIPEQDSTKRRQLTRSLVSSGFGCLQKSVWIAPCLPPLFESIAAGNDENCSQLTILCADSKGKKGDAKMVATAWNFAAIHENYDAVRRILAEFPDIAKTGSREALDRWSAEERDAWLTALRADPLLPGELLPTAYPARRILKQRKEVLAEAARLARHLVS